MPKDKLNRKQKRRHRPICLQIWVATSGCWTVAAVVVPAEPAGVWLSLALGTLIAWGSGQAVRRLTGGAEPQPTAGLANLTSLPTVFGLAAMAIVTGVVGFGEQADDKGAITWTLLIGYLAEHLVPYAVRKVRNGWRWLVRTFKTGFREAIREALAEDNRTRRNRKSQIGSELAAQARAGRPDQPRQRPRTQRREMPPAVRRLAAKVAAGDADDAELNEFLRSLARAGAIAR
ncbi:hypothetical protein ACIBXA_05140 [Micromonospora echinaurantiaca]|uniref:hypothetical protein n=1 Tax=Micromonospora echinaurantiaca TaxID=47857 RepID=UPI0037AF7CC3